MNSVRLLRAMTSWKILKRGWFRYCVWPSHLKPSHVCNHLLFSYFPPVCLQCRKQNFVTFLAQYKAINCNCSRHLAQGSSWTYFFNQAKTSVCLFLMSNSQPPGHVEGNTNFSVGENSHHTTHRGEKFMIKVTLWMPQDQLEIFWKPLL